MRERPILFSAPMVRAILAGEKTQTRRVMKHQPQRVVVTGFGPMLAIQQPRGQDRWLWPNARDEVIASCPYGKPGDKLWVRETWSRHIGSFGECFEYYYRATDDDGFGPWKPSIHMPREACRIMLEVTDVRVEKLQTISAEDAQAEGIEARDDAWRCYTSSAITHDPRCAFADLWESINGPTSWNANPWVWALTFKRVEP